MNFLQDHAQVFNRLNDLIQDYESNQGEGTFVDYHSPENLAAVIDPAAWNDPLNWDHLFDWSEY